MKQEDKELLLKDLCARLPYGVKFLRESWNYEWDQEMSIIEELKDIDKNGFINNTKVYSVIDIKPYLRPMSSMTEEEKKEYEATCDYYETLETYDWLNAHHFDYRGLIERDLAIAVTKENNPYEKTNNEEKSCLNCYYGRKNGFVCVQAGIPVPIIEAIIDCPFYKSKTYK